MPSYATHLEQRHRLCDNTYALTLTRPSDLTFTPGQYIRFHDGPRMRDYTLVNPPDAPYLEICVRHLPQGRFSSVLTKAPIGQAFTIEGPLGYFQFQSAPEDAVFVATGTGIAPFVAFARSGVRGFTLLHGERRLEDLSYGEELRAAARHYAGCLSELPERGADASVPWVVRGRVTDPLRALPTGPHDFYLCGNAAMIRDAIRIIDDRFEGARIFTETFF